MEALHSKERFALMRAAGRRQLRLNGMAPVPIASEFYDSWRPYYLPGSAAIKPSRYTLQTGNIN